MEEINKNPNQAVTTPSPVTAAATKPSSESTEASLEFELVSKKEKKFPIVWVLLSLFFISVITVGILIYLKIINLSFLL